MWMDISPTAPSAAMDWRSYCVAMTAAAGQSNPHFFYRKLSSDFSAVCLLLGI